MSMDGDIASRLANRLAVDTRTVESLKAGAAKNDPESLKAVAQQFEAVFWDMVMRSMRSAGEEMESGLFDSHESKLFRDMLDQQMSQSVAKRGLGIAEMLMRQMAPKSATPSGVETTAPVGAAAGAEPPSQSPKAFVDALLPHAQAAGRQLGLPPVFLIGHAALETGWGRHVPRLPDGGSSNNYFGIKAGSTWQGAVVESETREFINGREQVRVERFRAYPDPQAAFDDYARLLADNPRYAEVLRAGSTPEAFASALQQGGYATDPAYAQKLARVLHSVAMRQSLAGSQETT